MRSSHVSSGDDAPATQGHPIINISSDSDSAPSSQQGLPPSAFSTSTIVESSSMLASINRPTPRLPIVVERLSSPPPPSVAPDDVVDLDDSSPPPASQLSSAFCPYDISTASALYIEISGIAFSVGASSSIGMIPSQPCPSSHITCDNVCCLTLDTPATAADPLH
ncbi:hypothetical protein D1007_25346 [Hordeum vulgare]|nr:hypothetical protein D1007_25346 [Hordeum vulgare]